MKIPSPKPKLYGVAKELKELQPPLAQKLTALEVENLATKFEQPTGRMYHLLVDDLQFRRKTDGSVERPTTLPLQRSLDLQAAHPSKRIRPRPATKLG